MNGSTNAGFLGRDGSHCRSRRGYRAGRQRSIGRRLPLPGRARQALQEHPDRGDAHDDVLHPAGVVNSRVTIASRARGRGNHAPAAIRTGTARAAQDRCWTASRAPRDNRTTSSATIVNATCTERRRDGRLRTPVAPTIAGNNEPDKYDEPDHGEGDITRNLSSRPTVTFS